MGKPVHVFISFAEEDLEYRQELSKHLVLLEEAGLIKVWHYTQEPAGSEWEATVAEQLAQAQVVLALISPDFVNSRHCKRELEQAKAGYEKGTTRLIPIIVKAVSTEYLKIDHLTQIARDEPIASRRRNRQNKVWYDVAQDVARLAHDLGAPAPAPPLPPSASPATVAPLTGTVSGGQDAATTRRVSEGGARRPGFLRAWAHRHGKAIGGALVGAALLAFGVVRASRSEGLEALTASAERPSNGAPIPSLAPAATASPPELAKPPPSTPVTPPARAGLESQQSLPDAVATEPNSAATRPQKPALAPRASIAPEQAPPTSPALSPPRRQTVRLVLPDARQCQTVVSSLLAHFKDAKPLAAGVDCGLEAELTRDFIEKQSSLHTLGDCCFVERSEGPGPNSATWTIRRKQGRSDPNNAREPSCPACEEAGTACPCVELCSISYGRCIQKNNP